MTHTRFTSILLIGLIFRYINGNDHVISHLGHATAVIERYNRIEIKQFVILRDPIDNMEEESINLHPYIKSLPSSTSDHTSPRFLANIVYLKNLSHTLNRIEKSNSVTLTLLDDLKTLNMIQHSKPISQKFWIVVIPGDYQNHKKMYSAVKEMARFKSKTYFSTNLVNSQVYLLSRIKGIVRLFEIYQYCVYRPHILIKELGILSNDKRFQTQNMNDYIWDRRANLRLCTFKVGYFPWANMLTVEASSDTVKFNDYERHGMERKVFDVGGMKVSGANAQFFAIFQSMLNFSVNWVMVDHRQFGAPNKNKTGWNGLIGMIMRGEIDTTVWDLSISKARVEVIDITVPFRRYKFQLYMKKPEATLSWSTYFFVFDIQYSCVMKSVAYLCIFLLFLLNLKLSYATIEKTNFSTKLTFLGEAFSKVSRAFGGLGGDDEKEGILSRRILIFSILVCGMLNYYVFNGGLISYMMTEKYELPINELSDILKNPNYQLLTQGGGSEEVFFTTSNDVKHHQIFEKVVSEDGIVSGYAHAEGQIKVDDKKIFFASSPAFELFSDNYPCNIVASKPKLPIYPHSAGYGFKKDSPHIGLFNHQIHKIIEKVLETEFDNEIQKKGNCNEQNYRRFGYHDVVYPFLIFMIGTLVAAGFSVVEYFNKRRI